jgi:hypothetical protein
VRRSVSVLVHTSTVAVQLGARHAFKARSETEARKARLFPPAILCSWTSRSALRPLVTGSLSEASKDSSCGGGRTSPTLTTRATRAGSSAGKHSHTWRAFSNGASSRLRRPGCRSAVLRSSPSRFGARSVRAFCARIGARYRQFWRASLAAHPGRAIGRAVVMFPTTAPDAIRIGTKTRRFASPQTNRGRRTLDFRPLTSLLRTGSARVGART